MLFVQPYCLRSKITTRTFQKVANNGGGEKFLQNSPHTYSCKHIIESIKMLQKKRGHFVQNSLLFIQRYGFAYKIKIPRYKIFLV